MKTRIWDAKTKALIVLQELKGQPVAAICQEDQISQAPRNRLSTQKGGGRRDSRDCREIPLRRIEGRGTVL